MPDPVLDPAVPACLQRWRQWIFVPHGKIESKFQNLVLEDETSRKGKKSAVADITDPEPDVRAISARPCR
jgi:hypothetical protein